jgi:hypothetical protein
MRTCLRAHLEHGTPDSTELRRDRLNSQDIAYLENDAARRDSRMLALLRDFALTLTPSQSRP